MNHGGAAGQGTYYSLGARGKPSQTPPSSGISHPLSSLECLLHVAVIMGSFWDMTRGVWCRTQGSDQFEGSESYTLASLSRIFPTLPPSATVIRLGVAMATGEVT